MYVFPFFSNILLFGSEFGDFRICNERKIHQDEIHDESTFHFLF